MRNTLHKLPHLLLFAAAWAKINIIKWQILMLELSVRH
jgi:hypothetical protein